MPYSAGPNIAARPNLVFEYDLGDVQNSYKGEPTTNLVNPSWTAWSVDGSGQGNIGTRTIISPYYCQIVDNNANTRQSIYVEGISASTTYTFSVQYRSIAGAPTLRFQIQAYNGGSYISTMSFATTAQLGIVNNSEWQTAYITLTTPANTNRILWFMQDGDDYTTYTHAFELKNPQVEQKSHPTPFVVGTRSNTQGLLDISGYNRTINLSSVSFTSTAQMTFDGTDDFLNVSSNFGTFGQYTIEHVSFYQTVNRMPIASVGGPLFYQYGDNSWYYTHGGVSGEFYYNGSNWNGQGPINGWGHWTIVYDGSKVLIYRRGQLTGTQNTTGTADFTNGLRIGNYTGGGYPWNGQIAVVRFYNQALSAQEVLRNYNQLKTRFNIT